MEQREIGHELRTLNNLIRRELGQRFSEAGMEKVSGIQGPVVGFIYENGKERDIFQKDIEKEFNIRRSTATILLQNMEQKGFVTRVPVQHDGRLKKIILTPMAEEFHQRVKKQIDEFHRELEEGISHQEKEEFLRILDQIKKNLTR